MLARTKSKKRFGIWRTNFILTKKAVTKKNSRKPTRPTLFCLMIKNAPSMIPTAGCFLVEDLRRARGKRASMASAILIFLVFLLKARISVISILVKCLVIFLEVVRRVVDGVSAATIFLLIWRLFLKNQFLEWKEKFSLPSPAYVIFAVVRVRCRKKNVRSVAVWV